MTSENIRTTWYCYGNKTGGKKGHIEHINTGDKCTYPGCNLNRPKTPKTIYTNDADIDNEKLDKVTQDKIPQDKVLLTALSVLNLGSGYTTMVGAAQIFPGLVGYVSGGIIQLMLFLLLSGSAAKHAPVRKWLTVGVFSFISVYTSFFAYYDHLTAKDTGKKAFERAVAANAEVYTEVIAPLKNNVSELEGEIKQLRIDLDRELNQPGNSFTGKRGDGNEAQKIRIQIKQKESELAKLKPSVIEFDKKYPSPKQGDSPQEIFKDTIQAVQLIPNKYRPQEYQGNLNKLRPKFLDEDTGIPLLTPYRKVMKGEDSAIAAILLAIGVDGLIILLGTAIDKRKKIKLDLPLKGTALGFLDTLFKEVNLETGLINYENLIQNKESENFRLLLETMRSSDLKWVEVHIEDNVEKWYISDNKRDEFRKWYFDERKYQLKNEQKSPKTVQTPHIVGFVLPSRN
ncbi:hypothetical protein H6G33_34150 [Calothrix sp. FACHB-1219]|uniref:hypothetical protein n=1 Tax=unclassified Calothrix TaxID=2619626 RepID=UPI00168911EA|nr:MULTISPECIES: hypothetical protein [unclassified Calothrix]MBD2207415.1 hypothetical protein [Calothrix sp. FACHB-168]MBD2221991.1 hypothetical protein [Calothrix sp. FACHB-1219]